MANNVPANVGSGGAIFGTTEVSSIHYPISKTAYGGSADVTFVTSATPFPVQLRTGTGVALADETNNLLKVGQSSASLLLATVMAATNSFAVADNQVVADNAGFTDGTTKLFMMGYVFDETAGTALTENDAAAARVDSKRASVAVIEDATTRGLRASVSSRGAFFAEGPTSASALLAAPPVTVGGRSSDSVPTAVGSDGSVVNAWMGRRGEQVVAIEPKAFGGAAPYSLICASGNNFTCVKSSPGVLYNCNATNINSTWRVLKLYNLAIVPIAASHTPVLRYVIPGATPGGAGFDIPLASVGCQFSSGLAFGVSTGLADTDTTGVSSGDVVINLIYK